jgi:exonuclease SbcD
MNQEFENHDFAIVISKLTYQNKVTGTAQLFAIGENVASLSPKEIFLKRIEGDEIEAKTRRELVEAFDELLREISENS